MILRSLNTRYAKLIRKVTVISIGLLLATGSLSHSAGADNSLPALQNAAAITYLTEHKLYDSLRAILNTAHIPKGNFEFATADFSNEQNLSASDGAPIDQFGRSVAISGSTIVVGAPFDNSGGNTFQGSAYVFNRQGGGWVETQKLTASDGAAGDEFGWSVAISGSTILVSSWLDDTNGNVDQGSVYVFNRQGGSWVEEQKLLASDAAERDRFGFSIASSGSILVAATFGDNAEGSVYVFDRRGKNWVQEQKLTASVAVPGTHFGNSVAVSGSTIVAGSALTTTLFEGTAYVFNRQGGSWVETQKLTASDGTGANIFGWSVAISGSTIVVGAWGGAVGTNPDQGAAYVFNRQGKSWVETQKLTASDGAPFDEFGWTVAISDSTIVVSSELQAIGGNSTQGFAYIYNRQGNNWVETQKLIASDGEPHDRFGWSIAANGPTFVLGALGDNSFQARPTSLDPNAGSR